MVSDSDKLTSFLKTRQINRRSFLLSSIAALAVTGCSNDEGASISTTLSNGSGIAAAPTEAPPIPIQGINHMTLGVSDPAASLAWYQGLFGMPISARIGGTTVLQIGDGPQFIAIGGNPSDNPRITHYCLAVENFDDKQIVQILTEHGIAATDQTKSMQSRVRMRGEESGGAPTGTPELYFGDPDGIVVQLQDSTYCGGSGLLGEECLATPEPAPTEGLITVKGFNHFTLFVEDQQRAIQFYQQLFGLPIDTYQGSLPILRVGSGNEFLALSQTPPPPSGRIHHVSLTIEDFDVERIFAVLEGYGLTILGEAGGTNLPLQAYVTMRGPERGGAPNGTPEVYFTDPDGIRIQLQDASYCGGSGYFGDVCGTAENPI